MLQSTLMLPLTAPAAGAATSRVQCARLPRSVPGCQGFQRGVPGFGRVRPQRTATDLKPTADLKPAAAASGSSTPDSENKYYVPFWKGQVWNLLGNLVLGSAALVIARGQEALTKEALLAPLAASGGFDWFRLGVYMSCAFHVFVATSWRGQLSHKFYTNLLGEKGGLYTYTTICFSSIWIRLGVIIKCALVSGGALWASSNLLTGLLIIPTLPVVYAYLSFQWELGTLRRCGADHFDPDYYKTLPLVTTGIFRFISNPLYSFASIIYILPALFTGSLESLLIGAHVYICQWLLWYSVEADDMKAIYGD